MIFFLPSRLQGLFCSAKERPALMNRKDKPEGPRSAFRWVLESDLNKRPFDTSRHAAAHLVSSRSDDNDFKVRESVFVSLP